MNQPSGGAPYQGPGGLYQGPGGGPNQSSGGAQYQPPAGGPHHPSSWASGPPPAGMPGHQPLPMAGMPSTSNGFSIGAMVLGAISLLFLPIILGPGGIALAIVGMNRKEPLAKIALGVAIAGMVLGFVLGAIVFASL